VGGFQIFEGEKNGGREGGSEGGRERGREGRDKGREGRIWGDKEGDGEGGGGGRESKRERKRERPYLSTPCPRSRLVVLQCVAVCCSVLQWKEKETLSINSMPSYTFCKSALTLLFSSGTASSACVVHN